MIRKGSISLSRGITDIWLSLGKKQNIETSSDPEVHLFLSDPEVHLFLMVCPSENLILMNYRNKAIFHDNCEVLKYGENE